MAKEKDIFRAIRKYCYINPYGTGNLQITIKKPILEQQAIDVKKRMLLICFDSVEYEKLLKEIAVAQKHIEQYENVQRDEAQKAVDAGYAIWIGADKMAYQFKSHTKIPWGQCPEVIKQELAFLAAHPGHTKTCEIRRDLFSADPKDLENEDVVLNEEESRAMEDVLKMRKTETTIDDLPWAERHLYQDKKE